MVPVLRIHDCTRPDQKFLTHHWILVEQGINRERERESKYTEKQKEASCQVRGLTNNSVCSTSTPPPTLNTNHPIYLVGTTVSSTAEKTSRQLQEDPDVLLAQKVIMLDSSYQSTAIKGINHHSLFKLEQPLTLKNTL